MKLLVRTDATVAMGTGHAMRCLALAQAWQDRGGHVVFATAEMIPAVEERIRSERIEIAKINAKAGSKEDAAEMADFGSRYSAKWIVIDGYQFNAEYQRELRDRGLKVLAVDDTGQSSHYFSNIVLNQNLHADEASYQNREPDTRLLLGPKYAMLRREFEQWRSWQREINPEVKKILVMMGGSDPGNFTSAVIEALGRLEGADIEVRVVVGGGNPRREELSKQLAESSLKGGLMVNVENMPELMSWADVAISAAGSTVWEMCFFGLPSVVVDIAENQQPIAIALNEHKAGVYAGNSRETTVSMIADEIQLLMNSRRLRSEISANAKALVDGRGADRVIAAMLGISLRFATLDDSRLLWAWANDPDARAMSFSPEPISWESHQGWFAGKMQDPKCEIFIAEDESRTPVGQFRVGWISEYDGEVDVAISREHRGLGYGVSLIDLAADRILSERRTAKLHAYVKEGNKASQVAFQGAGFRCLGMETLQGHSVIHYIRTAKGE